MAACTWPAQIDTSTEFLGQKLRLPVMLAPIGSLQAFTPTGGVAAAQAAAEFGVMHVVSTATQPTLEEIAATLTKDREETVNQVLGR